MAAIEHVLKAGDTFPSIYVTVTDSLGNVVNLTGASVDFVMVRDTGDLVITDDAILDDPADGVVRYDWQTGDTDVPGRYNIEFVVTFANRKILTAPNGEYIELLIVPRLPTA